MATSDMRKVVVPSSTSLTNGNKFVVTQSNQGTTVIQPDGSVQTVKTTQPQYIVTPVAGGSGSAVNQSSGDHSPYQAVQYVGGNTPQTSSVAETIVYASGQPLTATQYQNFGTTYRSPDGQPYSTFTASNQLTGQNIHIQGEMIQHMGQTLFIPGNTLEPDMYPLAHTTRAAPATVQWLLDNYETADGVSLPRSTLYDHYTYHCKTNNLDPMNPASFGKLIRSVFVGLRTRRLGTRGNSKYHYYGIRLKSTSNLNHLMPDETPVAMRQPAVYTQRRAVKSEADSAPVTPKSEHSSTTESIIQTQEDKRKELLDTHIDAIPNISINIDKEMLPPGVTLNDVQIFQSLYKEHSQNILEVVINLNFSAVSDIWQKFWRKVPSADERKLSTDKLFLLTSITNVQTYLREYDYTFYQSLVEVLIPDVLRPVTGNLTQNIRSFAKGLENWMKNSLSEVPITVLNVKLTTLTAFSQTLRRYTSLNHLAQAARAVLQNPNQVTQMLTDLNRVDFSNIQEQCSWVTLCNDNMITEIELSFKEHLNLNNTLEEWAQWLDKILDKLLSGRSGADISDIARQCLLNWSFYCSMVIRDLTLRSAASFGSFHLIRLLFDEYLVYLVEHKVAGHLSMTPLTVTSELMKGKRPAPADIHEVDLDSAVNGHVEGMHVFKHFKLSSDPLLISKPETD